MRSTCLALILVFLGLGLASCSSRPPVDENVAKLEPADIDRLCGAPWVGTLTYLDYTSGQHTTIDSNVTVRRVGSKPATWEVGIGYSKEPHADARELVSLSADGTKLDSELVIAATRSPDGKLRFVTECDGMDDNRPATFRLEHDVTARTYSRRKMVRFAGASEWFERHIYRWSR